MPAGHLRPAPAHSFRKRSTVNALVYQKPYFIYILTNALETVPYTGVTNNLQQRIPEHYGNGGQPRSFCGRYHVYWLLYFEAHRYSNDAIAREKKSKAGAGKRRGNALQK